MIFETERLILRPWMEQDAEELYRYAKDPNVGPMAGWPIHTSVESSCDVIRTALSEPHTYAVVYKETNLPVGSVGLKLSGYSSLLQGEQEGEIGYWIGVPYWGKGLIPEAVAELLRYGFEDLGLEVIWCGYFDGNEKSRRVQEKCGFRYHHTLKDQEWTLIHEIKTQHVTRILKEELQEKGIKKQRESNQ